MTGEATYTATFKQVVNKYTVTWKNEDGSILTTEEVEYGKTPSYQGETPTKEATAQYTFTFKGWDQEIAAVIGNVTYTATYSSTVNKYTVTWQNEDGTVLFNQVLEYGEMPSYVGETPTKEASAQYTFTFRDWDKKVGAVTGDVTYTATYHYTVNNYTVKFVDEDGRVLQENVLPYGTTPEFVGETPVKAGNVQYSYRFDGWDKEIVSVTGDATYTAIYLQTVNKYTITWIVDGEETTEELEYGAAISKPIPTKEHHTFMGWTPEVPEVMPGENLTFTATWRWSYTGFLTEDSKIFYYVDGVKQSCGLVLVDGYYYYVRTASGEVVTDRTYWVTYTNGLMDEGNHTFDEQGRMIDPPGTEKKNGFVSENGGIYYYVDGELQKSGLVKVDGYYYYVRTSSGEVVTGRTYWVTYTNNLVEEGNYTFDAEGRMVNPPAGGGVAPDQPGVVKNGFVSENGGIYYYVDGKLQKCGLVKVDGYYYYVRTSSGEVVTGRTYWITYTNDLMEEGNYAFDEQGRMILN